MIKLIRVRENKSAFLAEKFLNKMKKHLRVIVFDVRPGSMMGGDDLENLGEVC